jgi:hypothetical protein
MCILIPLSDVTTICPIFKDKTDDCVTLEGICCMIVESERCTEPTSVIATGVECEVKKRDKRFACLEGCSIVSAEE